MTENCKEKGWARIAKSAVNLAKVILEYPVLTTIFVICTIFIFAPEPVSLKILDVSEKVLRSIFEIIK